MAAALNLKLLAVNFLCIFPFLIFLSEAKIASYIHEDDSLVQSSFCHDTILSFLPPPYRRQKGFACSQPWGSVSFKYFQDSDNVTTIVLSKDKFLGWIGIGFSKDGGMVGSSAVVGWTGGVKNIDNDKDEVEPGIAKFLLEGKNVESVTSFKGEFNFTDTPPFVILNNNSFYMGFQAKFDAPLGQQYMILAIGSDQPTLTPHSKEPSDRLVRLTKHTDQAVMQVDFSSGHNSGVKRHGDLKASHGAMGLIAWGVLLPFGAIIPRYFKHHDPQWFYLHISIQIVGFLLGLSTVLVGTVLYSGLDSNRTPRLKIHRPIGSLAFFLSILQVMALILRPDKASKWRKYWNLYHHWAGRLALFLGGLNIVIGIWVAEAGSSWKITYGLFVTFILLTVAVLEASLGLGRSKKADASPVFGSN
ncbi:cytochrome b561 and DOMON domain-containing protein At3g61750-like [Vitis riparia]|uniref:cytochrome b561 and DOMON domain-containing protein At3g61750-like n=1 Tax=Vitis riparia TaxID=96939 RepID=UPI00155A5784|nr:cytochrome b561 and DOMON domain-containing protein At3g61750-like [Vitis riparia]